MNLKRYFSLSSLSAVSLFAWTLFSVLGADEMKTAIKVFMPFLGDRGALLLFSAMLVFYSVSGLLIYLGMGGGKLAGIVFRLMLAVTFMAAAVPKILDPAGFALDISHYDFFPRSVVNIIAITVPWVEGVIALSLILTVFDRGGVALVNIMMAAFLVLLGQAWFRGLDIDCGCFGHTGATEAVSKVFVRDLFMISWSILLFLYMWKEREREAAPAPRA